MANLQHLNLSGHQGLTSQGLQALAGMTALTYLNLAGETACTAAVLPSCGDHDLCLPVLLLLCCSVVTILPCYAE